MYRFVAFFLLTVSASQAQEANHKAEAEAIGFLKPCHQQTKDSEGLCQQNQLNFVEQYILAKSGDLGGMGSTAASFTPARNDDSRAMKIGMPQNQTQACAWRIVIARLRQNTASAYLDNQMVRSACASLSPVPARAAEQRADALMHELRASPASIPSDDWCAHVPWIKVDCTAPPPQGPLTTTIAPLKTD